MTASKRDWFVYIIEANNGHLYTGITTNLDRRFNEHKTKQGGARFFHTSSAKKMVYHEPHADRSSASKRESAIKKLSRQNKIQLIAQQ